MEIIRELIRSESPTATALGYFDGVHCGHRAVISEAVAYAQAHGLVPTVFTLQQSPRLVLFGEAPKHIIPPEDKLAAFEALGVQRVYLIDFRTIRHMDAESFVRDILVGCFHAAHAGCGFNYHFGSGASGNGEVLHTLCRQYGVSETTQPQLSFRGLPISSTRIRRCIAQGDIPAANEMLGRPYGFCLPVIHGRRLGHTLGFPTLNQRFPEGLVQPPFGVYGAWVTVDGRRYRGIANIGVKPTVGSDEVLIETWMPHYDGRELYGEKLEICFDRFLRSEQKFAGLEELKAAIERDREQLEESDKEVSG